MPIISRTLSTALRCFCLLGLLLSLAACQPSEVVEKLNQDVGRYTRQENEPFKLVTIDFQNNGKETDWFRDSKVAADLNQAIVDGVNQAGRQDGRLQFMGRLKSESTNEFYAHLKTKTDQERRRYLHQFLTEQEANFLVFGQFNGDDYEITVAPFAYSSTRQTIAKGEVKKYARGEDKRQIYDKVALQVRDMLLQVMNSPTASPTASRKLTRN